jgi:sugar phosphate isomerase/epimerase
MRALKKIGYQGYLTLEADQYLSAYQSENVMEGCKRLAEAARKLTDMYDRF